MYFQGVDFGVSSLYQLPGAAVANLHTVGGSKQQRDNLPFHSLEARSPKSRCLQGWLLLEGSGGGCVLGARCLSAAPRLAALSLPSRPLSSHGLLSFVSMSLCVPSSPQADTSCIRLGALPPPWLRYDRLATNDICLEPSPK